MAIPTNHKETLEFICAAAAEGTLAALEVTEKKTGEPGFLLIAVKETEDGSFDIAPLARLDVDFLEEFNNPGTENDVLCPEDCPHEDPS
jgi:hypothetical protein